MTENIENLLLEHMKRFQAGQDRIERKLEEVVSRIGHLEVSVAGLRCEVQALGPVAPFPAVWRQNNYLTPMRRTSILGP